MQSPDDTTQVEQAKTILIPASNDIRVQETARDATSLLRQADLLTIDSNDMYELANEMLSDVHARGKLLEKARLAITDPINQGLKAVRDMFRTPEENLDVAKSTLKRKMVTWQVAVEEERKAAEAAAAEAHRRELAEATAKLAAAEDEVGSGDAPIEMLLEAEQRMAEVEVSTPHVPVVSKPSGGGHALGEKWSAEVTDLPKFLHWLADELAKGDVKFDNTVSIKVAQLNNFAKATKGTVPIPGITYKNEKTLAAR